MSEVISDDYPEHLNPFEENYNPLATAPVAPPRVSGNRQKYNTWNSNRHHQVAKQSKPALLESPWAALNISPKGKLVRRLSVLKTAVERFTTKKKKRLEHSNSFNEANIHPRSNSLHEDFNYRIFSPKIKEKIRQQVFARPSNAQESRTDEMNDTEYQHEKRNGQPRMSLNLDSECIKTDSCSPTTPEHENLVQLGARPKTRKKRPPPPPPAETSKQDIKNGQQRAYDTVSVNSSITQDLEKDAFADDDSSLVEADLQCNRTELENHHDPH